MKQNQNYVISLISAEKRRQHIKDQFSLQQIPFQFFDALIPSETLTAAIRQFCPNLETSNRLTNGEKACFMSHVALWQKCVDEDLPYMAIFEDDVYLGEDAETLLSNTHWLEERFADKAVVIRLEASWIPAEHYYCSIIQPISNRSFLTLATVQHGTAAYIISKPAAQKLLQKCFTLLETELKPFDHILFETWLNQPEYFICQLSPALAIQADQYQQLTNLISQLQTERQVRLNVENHPKRSLWEYFLRLLTKPKRQQEKKIHFAIEAYQQSRKNMIPFK